MIERRKYLRLMKRDDAEPNTGELKWDLPLILQTQGGPRPSVFTKASPRSTGRGRKVKSERELLPCPEDPAHLSSEVEGRLIRTHVRFKRV